MEAKDIYYASASPFSLPVVRELELKTSVIGCFYGDDVSEEVGSQKKTKRFDDVWLFGLASRQAQLGKLFVGKQHDQIGTEDDSSKKRFTYTRAQSRGAPYLAFFSL